MNRSLPDGWTQESLEHFAEINPRLTDRNLLDDETEVSFFKMEDVSNQAKIINRNIRRYRDVSKGFTCFQNEDVLVAKITPCFENGKGAYVDRLVNGVGFGSTEFHVLRAKKNANPRFIYHFTNYQTFRMQGESNMTGSAGQRRVPTDFFRTYPAIFPPAEEQQKIASILTAVDEVLASTTAQINKLKDLKTGMMQELLTKGIGHAEFKDSPVGRIPKRWQVVELSDLAEKISDGLHSTPEYVDYSEYIFVNGNNLKNDRIEFGTSTKYVSESEYLKHRKDLDENSILMSINGTIGSLAYFAGERIVLGKSAAYINLKSDVEKQFIFHSLSSSRVKAYFDFELTGTTIKNLSLKSIKNTPIAVPPRSEQKEISSIIGSIEKKVLMATARLKNCEKVKNGLMQDLLTGKVRVTNL